MNAALNGQIIYNAGRVGRVVRRLGGVAGTGKVRVKTERMRSSQDFSTGKITEYRAAVEETWMLADCTTEELTK